MLLIILSSVLACLLGWLALQFHLISQYWAKRGVPHNPPHPLFGNLSFMFKLNVGEWMRDLHLRFREPVVGIWVFWKPVLVVGDPQIARRVLVQDHEVFRDRYLSSGRSDPIGAMNIFTLNEPTWSNVRRRLTYLFTAAKLKALAPLVLMKSDELVQRINRDQAEKRPIEVRDLLTDFSTDIIGTFAFGIENNALLTGDSPIRVVTRDFMKFNWFRGLGWYSIFFWPGLVDIFGFSLFPKKSTDFFRKTVHAIIEQRTASKIEKTDLIDALIKMKKEGLEDGEEITDDLLVAQACIMLQGGFDTNASAMAYMIIELAHNAEVQEKLHEEIAEVKRQNGDAKMDYSSLENLKYLTSAIKETLRKYPPMGWLDRIAASDYEISDKLTISRGTPVYVNAIGMHYDPELFPNPNSFDLDRFLPENESNIVPYSYMPFGDGPRFCIGQRFAMMTMRFVMAELISQFEFKPLPGYPKPEDLQFEKKGLFLMPGEHLSVDFVPRA